MCLYARIDRGPADEGSMCDHASLSTGAGADQARSRGEVAGAPFARLRNMEREQAAKGPRHAGLVLLGCCLAGCALVIAVAAGRGSSAAEAGALLRAMPAAQQCPPPCVPHVFSQSEEAMLAGGQHKGKIVLPGGDSAVEEAMRAASDANGQMTDDGAADASAPPLAPRPTARTAGGGSGQGPHGHPFISQWDLMHGGAAAAASVSSPAAEGSVVQSVQGLANPRRLQARQSFHADEGTRVRGSDGMSREDVRRRSERAGALADDAEASARDGEARRERRGGLNAALRQLSNRRLRAIVRLLLKARANAEGYAGRRGGVEELRAVLDGSRRRQEEKRAAERIELRRVRKAMDELAFESSRRREEDDAIMALEKRLGGSAFRGTMYHTMDQGRRRRRGEGQGQGHAGLRAEAPARLDALYQLDGARGPWDSRTGRDGAAQLMSLLGAGGGRSAERGAAAQRGWRSAASHSSSPEARGEGPAALRAAEARARGAEDVAEGTKGSRRASDAAIVEELTRLAARGRAAIEH